MSSPSVLSARPYALNLQRIHTRRLSMANMPTSPPESPTDSAGIHRNRDLAFQMYLLLQEEHDLVHRHLDSVHASAASRNTVPTPPVSPRGADYPPSQTSSRSASLSRAHAQRHRRSSVPAVAPGPAPCVTPTSCRNTVLDETTGAELLADEARLCHVNECIKRILTELLNCETVRDDRALRTWAQSRLMATEKELRTERRRRSAPETSLPV